MNQRLATLALLMTLALAPVANASKTGIYDFYHPATGGCAACHAGVLPNPSPAVRVLILLDNTPIEAFPGYEPGKAYNLSIWVLGPILPFAGFNLRVSAGTLVNSDATAQTQARTECELAAANSYPRCDAGGGQCKIKGGDDCPVFDVTNAACEVCGPSQPDCRPCDPVNIADLQATHDYSTLFTAAKPVPGWDFVWTAPASGDVRFWAAGNSVSGEGTNAFDHFNFLSPDPIVISPR